MVDFFKIVDKSWRVLGPLLGLHSVIYRATRGRIGARLSFVPPMLILDHIGAKTSKLRTVTLVYMPLGDNFLIAAGKGGHPKNPDWLYNLRAHPDTEVQVGPRRIRVHARETDAEERARLWPEAAAYNWHWRRYQRRTKRLIPLLILEPVDPALIRRD